MGVLNKINNFQWSASTFIIPKINGIAKLIPYFKVLNKRIKSKPFPIPKHAKLVT